MLNAVLVLALAFTGCSSVTFTPSTGSASSPAPGSPQFTVKGSLIGGRKAISGSTVSLVEAGTSGKTSSTVLSTTTTDSQGDFTLPNPSCHYPDSQLYLTAAGGDAGNGINPSILLSAMVGPCKTVPSHVIINEFSTAAAAYAFNRFFDRSDVSKVGADGPPGTDQYIGITNAGALLTTNLVFVPQGVPSLKLGVGSNPEKILNSVADILVYCVNSPAPYSNCDSLFNLLFTKTKNSDPDPDDSGASGNNNNSGPPKNTLSAAVYIAHHPAKHVSDLFGLLSHLPVAAPFTPFLGTSPDSFLLALTYTPGDLDGMKQIAIDQPGNVWIANGKGNSVTELSPLGVKLSPAGGYKAGGTLNGPESLVFDSSQNIWITNNLDNTVEAIDTSGKVVVGPFGDRSTYFGPKGLALDSLNLVWVADNQSSDKKKQLTVSTTGGAFSFFVGAKRFGLEMPVELVADTTLSPNLIWVSNSGDGGVTRIIADGKSKDGGDGGDNGDDAQPNDNGNGKSKLQGTHIPGGGQDKQGGIALDNCGNVWVANTPGSVTKILNGMDKHDDANPQDSQDNGKNQDVIGPIAVGGITSSSNPFGITTDSANHVWVLNQNGNSVTELNTRGKALSPSNGFTALGVISGPYNGIAIDRSGNVWIANAGNNTMTEFVGAAAPVATPRTQGRPISPKGPPPSNSNTCPNPCSGNGTVDGKGSCGGNGGGDGGDGGNGGNGDGGNGDGGNGNGDGA